MRKQDQLVSLIKSLSASEKKYFVQTANADGQAKSYLKLYEALLKADTYDTDLLSKQLGKKKADLANEKKYLEYLLIRTLRNTHENEPIVSLHLEMAEITTLENKGQYHLILDRIPRLKQKAIRHGFYEIASILCKSEVVALQNTMGDGDPKFEKLSINLVKESNEWLSAAATENELCILISESGPYVDGIKNNRINAANRFLQRPVLKQEPKLIYLRKLYYTNVATMYYIKQDLEKQTLYQEKSNQLSFKYPVETRITPYQYCADVNNLFRSYMRLGHWAKAEKMLKEMAAKTYYKTNLDPRQLDAFFQPILVELRIYLVMSKVRLGHLNPAQARAELAIYEKNLPLLQKSVFTNNYVTSLHIAAKVSLLAGLANEAIYWAQKVINETEKTIRPPVQASAKLALLVAHQELGNDNILPSLVASTKRVYEKYKLLTQVETTTFNAILQLVKTNDNKQRVKIFTQLQKQYRAFAKNKKLWPAVMQVNLIQWTERNLGKLGMRK